MANRTHREPADLAGSPPCAVSPWPRPASGPALHLRHVVCRRARPRPGRRGLRLGLHASASRVARRVPTAGSTSRRGRSRRSRSTASTSTPPRCVDGRLAAAGAAGRQRARRARDHGLQPRRAGPAPGHRPRRPAATTSTGTSSSTPPPASSPASTSPTSRRPTTSRCGAPQDWIVSRQRRGDPGRRRARWRLATTQPLATYFVTVCAGPVRLRADEHDGIPLGLHARASLREPLERHAAEIFEVTRR